MPIGRGTRWLVPAVACVIVAAAGCASSVTSGSPTTVGGTGGGGSTGGSGDTGGGNCGSAEPGLCTTFEITGAVAVHGTVHVGFALSGSCTEYVKGQPEDPTHLVLPVALGVTVDGHKLGVANRVSKYHGPGTYQKSSLGAVDGGIHVDVDTDSYQSSDGTTATAEIKADGGGSFVFTDLKEATNSSDTSPKGKISGSYRWTCQGS